MDPDVEFEVLLVLFCEVVWAAEPDVEFEAPLAVEFVEFVVMVCASAEPRPAVARPAIRTSASAKYVLFIRQGEPPLILMISLHSNLSKVGDLIPQIVPVQL